MARSHFGSPSIAGSILWKGREAERGIWANLDGNTRIEAREARFHGEQKRNGPQWPRVKSAHSSFFRAFSALFSLLSNGWGLGGGVGGLVCRYVRGMRHEKPPAGQIFERDGCLISRSLAKSRTDRIRSRFLLAVHRRMQFGGIGTLFLCWSKAESPWNNSLLIDGLFTKLDYYRFVVSCGVCENVSCVTILVRVNFIGNICLS